MQTQQYLLFVYAFNLALMTWAYSIPGLLGSIALSAGVYYIVNAKLGDYKSLNYKLAMGVVFIAGIFAISKVFQNDILTAVAAIFEVAAFIIFTTIGE